MHLSENEIFGPSSELMNPQPATPQSWFDSFDIGKIIETGIKSWAAVETVQTQAEIAKAQAAAGIQYPVYNRTGQVTQPIRNPLTGAIDYPTDYPDYGAGFNTQNILLYGGLAAAGLLIIYLASGK